MRTTINMRVDILDRLSLLSKKTGIRKDDIIRYVLKKITKEQPLPTKCLKGMSYQESFSDWRLFHITFDGFECELNLDLKKFYKLSLSFLVAYGIRKYGDSLLVDDSLPAGEEFQFIMDSYTLKEYVFYSVESDSQKNMGYVWIFDS